MTLPTNLKLTEIEASGKQFEWIRPAMCSRCESKVWGHGYVQRFFNQIKDFIFLKRWRCPVCKIVITCRPIEYWRRYQESIDLIFEALKYRTKNLTWPPSTTRQRGGHWLNKLIRKAKVDMLLKECMFETTHFFQQKQLTIF